MLGIFTEHHHAPPDREVGNNYRVSGAKVLTQSTGNWFEASFELPVGLHYPRVGLLLVPETLSKPIEYRTVRAVDLGFGVEIGSKAASCDDELNRMILRPKAVEGGLDGP